MKNSVDKYVPESAFYSWRTLRMRSKIVQCDDIKHTKRGHGMNCPKCQSIMHEISFEGVVVDFCDACQGIWFDEDELAFTMELSSDIPNIAEVEKSARTTAYPCPRCGDPQKLDEMKFVAAKDLLIDRCPRCKGVWIDKGELPKIKAIAARIGDAKSKILLACRQLSAKDKKV